MKGFSIVDGECMKLSHFFGFLFVFFEITQGQACITTKELGPFNPEVQIRSYFWMPQLKRGIRIARTTVHGESFFIMIGCQGLRTPSIETMDDWTLADCRPLGDVWLPMPEPEKLKNPETSYFIKKFEESLENHSDGFSNDDLISKAVDITKTFIEGSFGLALVTLPGVPEKVKAQKDASSRKRWIRVRGLVKAIGWLWIFNALWEAFDIYRQDSGTQESEAVKELEKILLSIEKNGILHLDGEETDRRVDHLFSFESILDSFEKAALQTYQDICQSN